MGCIKRTKQVKNMYISLRQLTYLECYFQISDGKKKSSEKEE